VRSILKRVTFKEYAGVSIKGDVDLGPPGPRHMDAASWLTAQVESGGKFGTVISYDGTGITAGIHQAIAVYPNELTFKDDGNALDDQGPLWKLLDRCFKAHPDLQLVTDMKQYLFDLGMVLVNGVVHDSRTEKPVHGRFIRHVLTGSTEGVTPLDGPGRKRAEEAAGMFSVFFSDLRMQKIQLEWGGEHLLSRVQKTKLRYLRENYRHMTAQEILYDRIGSGFDASSVLRKDLPPEFDLAMCVWMSYTVNAPSVALRKICKVVKDFNYDQYNIIVFSKELIEILGKAKWGRWDANLKNGRYQRTRNYAKQVWPKDLFEPFSIMPKSLR
jgi:hypothetical protein